MAQFDRDGMRATGIVVLLVATFLLTAFMALRAQLAARYHQATAENVIRDWTRVAADEFGRQSEAQAGFFGTYPMLQTIVAMPELPSRAALLAGAKDDDGRRNARLVACVFRFTPATGAVQGPECPAAVRAWLLPRLVAIAAAPPPRAERVPFHGDIGGAAYTFVYTLPADASSVSGFLVDRSALGPFFARVLQSRPLMPASLAEGRITNDSIGIRVRDPSGREMFRSPRQFDGRLGIRLPLHDGLLRGMAVDAAIAPDVAPLLVFGGVPRPLRVYMVTLLLTAMLLFTALLQLRKERALARMRSEFVAGVSHELRTPLTQIRMFAETLLLDRVRSDDERRRSLSIIDQETRRLAQLVENVLQFSRGERGTLRITRRSVDVAGIVAGAVEAFLPIAAARNVTIETAAAGAVLAAVDEDAVRQIVLNLLDNAVKYGPAGGAVRVTVALAGAEVRIAVADDGPGVPASDRKRIWRRYERLERERGRAIAGAGIGLAVVHELVALHGGRAWVESGAAGGALFHVALPAEATP